MALSKKQRLEVFNKSFGKCWYCGCDLPEKGWHADHVEAVYRGFDMVLNKKPNGFTHTSKNNGEMAKPENDKVDNIVPSCAPCNLFKATSSIEQLRNHLSKQVDRGIKSNVNFRMAIKYGLVEITNKPVRFWFEDNAIGVNNK
jgi:hypothetical protein